MTTLCSTDDLVYFVLPVPDSKVPMLIQMVGKVENVSDTHYEVRRALDSVPSFGLDSLSKEFHPVVVVDETAVNKTETKEEVKKASQSNQTETKEPAQEVLAVVRIPHANVVAKIDPDTSSEELVWTVFSVARTGHLARITLTREGGKEKSVLGRVVSDLVWRRDSKDLSCIVKTFKSANKSFDVLAIRGAKKAKARRNRKQEQQVPTRSENLLHFSSDQDDFRIELKKVSEEDRRTLSKYLAAYEQILVRGASNFKDSRREIVSVVHAGKSAANDKSSGAENSWYCFTRENSFLSAATELGAPSLTFGVNGLSLVRSKPGLTPATETADTIYGTVIFSKDDASNKAGRDKLEWINATNCPGLDAYLCFANGGSRKPNLPERARGPQGEATIFSELLEGYFKPQTNNSTVARLKKLYLWEFDV